MAEAGANGQGAAPKRMLALDGGGLMGCISLGILAEVEKQLREISGDPKLVLGDVFDYIAGTSTGAIIATALRMGREVGEIRGFYEREGANIFSKAPLWKRVRSGFAFKFGRGHLVKILEAEFTGKTVLDLQKEGILPSDKHLLIVTRNVQTDSCWPLSTNPDAKYNKETHEMCNRKVPLWQLVRASTAAPTFFSPEVITFPNGREYPLVDGGLTPHNNPALKLYQMATMDKYACGWEDGEDRMMLLSIGTGLAAREVEKPSRVGSWIIGVAINTPSDLMRGASIENDVTCRMLGRCTYGPQIDRELGDMVRPAGCGGKFTYARYDADISNRTLAAMGISFPGKQLKMDAPEQIPAFLEIGERARGQVDMATHFAGLLP